MDGWIEEGIKTLDSAYIPLMYLSLDNLVWTSIQVPQSRGSYALHLPNILSSFVLPVLPG